jgi:type IV secretion system protein VirB10
MVGAAVLGVVGFDLWRSYNPPQPPVKEALPQTLGSIIAYQPPPMATAPRPAPAPAPAAAPAPPPASPASAPPLAPMPAYRPWSNPIVAASHPIKPTSAPKPYAVSIPVTTAADPSHAAGQGNGSTAGANGTSSADGDVVYADTKLKGQRAGLIGDQTLLLPPGLLPCILDNSIDSTFPGPIQCHIPMDIKPHGVVLLDRGTIIHAMYQSNVKTGQARLSAPASWIEDRATGCNVNLPDTPISDPLGETGIPGSVDNHYMQRLGAAVLLTFANSAVQLAQAALSQGGNTYLSFSSGGGGGVESIANTLLQNSINIPPTITVNQGTAIAVFVQKPIDFSRCYLLEFRNKQ